MPYAESGSDSNLWFSFNVGRMHYIAISTEHHYNPGRHRGRTFLPYLACFLNYPSGSPQYEWLESDLKKANDNRQHQPWIVVVSPYHAILLFL